VNAIMPAVRRLRILQEGHISIFKSTTGFSGAEFDELSASVCPLQINFARSTGIDRVQTGRPNKLSPQDRVLAFILLMKHNNNFRYESSIWNHSRSSVCDDAIFAASAINVALDSEIKWPSPERRAELARRVPDFPGCIGHIDGTLCRINRPSGPDHGLYYNGRKHVYYFNNVAAIDHDGLFIYVDARFGGSFHDVRCLRGSHIFANWRQYFRNDNLDVV
jgi:DDE superfamily endonuclease